MRVMSRGATPAASGRGRLRQWWQDRPVRLKGLLVIAVPLIVLIGTTVVTLALQHVEQSERSVAAADLNLTGAADQVLADAVNAQTGVRGYAVTGDQGLLAPYTVALRRIGADRRSLRVAAAAVGDRRRQRVVDATTGRAFSELAQLRAAVGAGAFVAGLRPALEVQSTTMGVLRGQVASLTRGHAALLVSQRARISWLEAMIDRLDVAGLALGLIAGLFGVALFTSGISRRVATAAANAEGLGQGRPLEPVGGSADEVGRLASALVRADELLAGWDAQQVKARLALLASIVESCDDAILSKDVDGLITSWNPAAERIYGYSADEVIGQHVELVLDPDLRGEGAEILSAFVREYGRDDSMGSLLVENVQRRRDGTTFPVSVMLSAIHSDDGSLIGTSSISRDTTKQRRAAAELSARMEDLERANRHLETFTYSVSHDLRAPLRALRGFSTALLDEYGDNLDDAGRGYAERIDAAAEQMALLIDDLLHLSRLWRTEIQGVREVDLSAEVTAIAGELQRSAPGRRAHFAIQPGVRVPADPVLIRTVLQNLLENAWKFTGKLDEARIEFGTRPADGAGTCCYVRDNGAGFDPEYVGKLFQPFQRLHPTREFAGTGVGLASVRQIVERHGGRAWAEGAVDQGATFWFTLNVREDGSV